MAADRTAERLKEHMRRLPLFEGLSEDELDDLVRGAEVRDLDAGEVLMREGEDGDRLYVVVDGELDVTARRDGRDDHVATRGAGEPVGEMALLERAPRSATVTARTPARVLGIDQDAFGTLLSCSATAAPTMLRTVMQRLRGAEAMLLNQAKLAALGTMAAGLAHELNNPAAAMRRSAAQLADAVAALERAAGGAAAAGTTAPGDGELAPPEAAGRMTAGERARLEGELEDLLERVGAARPWELAPALAGAGWRPDRLDATLAAADEAARPHLVALLAARAEVADLLGEARLAAEAVSRIVGAVKGYAYLDRAPVQDVDVHEGLEATLVILRHKLRDRVQVERVYAHDLPTIAAYGSELNQVWTNLVDNAVDAMGGEGTLTIRTGHDAREVRVGVADTGPGIPDEHLGRLFEPFFTTKRVGSGTGLGLHVVHEIVRRHGGRIEVDTSPAGTTFTVHLPRTLPAPAQSADSSSSR